MSVNVCLGMHMCMREEISLCVYVFVCVCIGIHELVCSLKMGLRFTVDLPTCSVALTLEST